VTFAVGWSPCVGTFLASALGLAAQAASAARGVAMLACFSAGLGVPFVLSALLVTQLEGAFVWVKGHYELVNRICGLLLVVVGVLMATGRLGTWMALLAA
jgi:cytochrome c-type biogenesis protein